MMTMTMMTGDDIALYTTCLLALLSDHHLHGEDGDYDDEDNSYYGDGIWGWWG